MGGLRILQKFLNFIQKTVDGISYRNEKRNGSVHGDDQSVQRTRRMISIFIIGAVILLLSAIGIRDGIIFNSNFFIDREVPSAPRAQLAINEKLARSDLDLLGSATAQSSDVNCSQLTARLQESGTLPAPEQRAYLKDCVPSLPKAMGDAVAKVLSSNLAADVNREIFKNLNQKNAAKIGELLDHQDVLSSLRGEGGGAVAESIAVLAGLNPDEAGLAAKIITETPPQYRANSLAALKDVAVVGDGDARASLLRAMGAARSPEEIAIIKDFAREVKNLSPDEQKMTADTFVKLATPQARRSMITATRELAKIDRDDPVRGRLLEKLTALAALPPERQVDGAATLGDIAGRYASERGPVKKQAIADAVAAAKSPDSLGGLSRRLASLDQIGPLPVKDLDLSDYLLGNKIDTVAKIDAAAEAVQRGAGQDAKNLISGDLLVEDTTYRRGAETPRVDTGVSVKQRLDEAESALKKTRREIQKSESEIITLKALELAPTDASVVRAYTKLGQLKLEEKTFVDEAEAARSELIAKIRALKNKTGEELATMGVAMPDLVVPASRLDAATDAPPERLSDLRDVPGFFDSLGSLKRTKKLHFGEISAAGEGRTKSLLDHSLAKMPTTWVVSGGPGAAGQSDRVGGFEMSRTQFAPGVMMRVPPKGIPSDRASKYTLFFKFIGAVADRKTGVITVPSGSVALCKVQDFDKNTGKMSAKCDRIDIGGSSDIDADLLLSDADGSDGLTGAVTDNRGWYLAGVFMTAFTAAVLDGYSQSLTAPFEAKTQKTLGDYTAQGSISGAALIARDIADKQIDEWQKSPYFWHSFDGALATVRQN